MFFVNTYFTVCSKVSNFPFPRFFITFTDFYEGFNSLLLVMRNGALPLQCFAREIDSTQAKNIFLAHA